MTKPLDQYSRGFILISALLLQSLLTLMVLSRNNQIIDFWPINHAAQEHQAAFYAAEQGLKHAAEQLAQLHRTGTPLKACSSTPADICGIQNDIDPAAQTLAWWQEKPRDSTQQCYWVVQYLYYVPDDLNPKTQWLKKGQHWYRLTSTGLNPKKDTRVLLEEVHVIQQY